MTLQVSVEEEIESREEKNKAEIEDHSKENVSYLILLYRK